MNYIERSKTAEARLFIKHIYDGAATYHASQQTNPKGFVFSAALPQQAQSSIAEPGRAPVPPHLQRWNMHAGLDSAWNSIGFASDEPNYYRYDFRAIAATGTVIGDNRSRPEACPAHDVAGIAVDINALDADAPHDAGGLFRESLGFYICAQGDLDGDGVRSYFWRIARAADDVPGAALVPAGGLRILNELE